MSIEWQGGAPVGVYPTRMAPTPEQQENILRHLHSVGITQDIFALDPIARLKLLSTDEFIAMAVYSAVIQEMKGSYERVQTFKVWSREMGLPW